jgi:adenine-specific DNA methylase
LNKKIGVPTQAKLFKQLGEIFLVQSQSLQNTGEMIKIYWKQAMRYYSQEHQPLSDLLEFRESQLKRFKEEEKALNEKKEQLWKTKNVNKWKFTGDKIELIGREKELLRDKNIAFAYILTEDSDKLQKQKEILNFYTNQLLAEMRRVGRDNGISLMDHFS